MNPRARVAALIGTSGVLGLLFVLTGSGTAGGEKDTAATIKQIAGLIAKGDASTAAGQAKALAKDTEVEEVMNLLRPRKKKGIGVGKTPNAIQPDGIEQQFLKLGRDELSSSELNKDAVALEHMGYVAAAVADFAIAKPPEKDQGQKTAKAWGESAKEMRQAALAFVEAAKSKSPASVHKAADKVNNACNSCHMVFRD
jgi:hypothetical protein